MGIDDDVEQIIELGMEDGELRHRKVISVFGMGGLGKTTVVKEVYKRAKTRFECYSWVSMLPSHGFMDVLRNILFGFKANKGESAIDVMDAKYEGQLQEMIYNYLQDKEYLLVLDDVWEAEVWEAVKHALPRDHGTIIITSRIRDIASSIEDNCRIYELQPLSHELAWSIFCRKVFRNQGYCPQHLKEYAEAVVRRCEGLPLAIVAVAGLFSAKAAEPQAFQSVLHELVWIYNDNRDVERLHKALLCSYIHLPYYLKYCFLQINLFPEDYEIGRKRLIRMWIAEGFVRKAPGKTEEETGNRYFKQLMYRSMIQAITLHARDVVKACKVHNLMREVANKMMKEEKFGAVLDGEELQTEDRYRRLSVYAEADNIPTNIGKLSIRSFHLFDTANLSNSALRKFLKELRLTRILNLQGVCIERLPEEVSNLIHLRYLDLRGTRINGLPKSVTNLRNLQTLDIRNTNVKVLPRGINRLQQLRHLLMASFSERDTADFIQMPKERLCFKELQTLSGVLCDEYFVKELRHLTNLRKLYMGKTTSTCSRELSTSLAELQKLRSLSIISGSSSEDLQLNSLSKPPKLLEKLKLQVFFIRLPNWFQHLNRLHTLSLLKSFLGEDPFPVLHLLPNLVVLTLASSAFTCSNISCRPQGFMKLTTLRILDIHTWIRWMPIEEGTMLSLRYLLIANCPNLQGLPEGFHHLTALQSLTLSGMSEHFPHANGHWTY